MLKPVLLTSIVLFQCSLSCLGCTLYRRVVPDFSLSPRRESRDITTNCGDGDIAPPNQANTTDHLSALRGMMAERGLAAYYVPYDTEGRREWISGFMGSNGDAIVTNAASGDQAACWTDGRYFLQASEELDCNWRLQRMGEEGVPTYTEWLMGDANLTTSAGETQVGADSTLLGAGTWLQMEVELAAGGLTLVDVGLNLIDEVWDDKPEDIPQTLVVHPFEYAGKTWQDKVADLRSYLDTQNLKGMVVSEGDEVAWLFNMRGELRGSNEYTSLYQFYPYFDSVALIDSDEIRLWLRQDAPRIEDIEAELGADVEILPFNDSLQDIAEWSSNLTDSDKVLISSPSIYLGGASYAIYEALTEEHAHLGDSPVLAAKAVKNAVEAAGMMEGHKRDAFALVEFLAQLEDEVEVSGVQTWDEISAASRLTDLRRAQDLNRGLSFPAISASGSNAAVIHYQPQESTVKGINTEDIYLLDSGGQYLDGTTTDVTRTMHYGSPSAEIIEMYTRVLMGHIDLARTSLPSGTSDYIMDYASRQPLYSVGMDYNHGTGHGIGAYLAVHEGPVGVGRDNSVLQENMFFSDEPGFYKDGEYGIRIESVLRVVNLDFGDETYGTFVGFESVTLVPFEPKLIDFSMMSPGQITWYNDYNAKIVEMISPHFEALGRADVTAWIASKTQRVEVGGDEPYNGQSPVTSAGLWIVALFTVIANTMRQT